jgi:hypothetical protein
MKMNWTCCWHQHPFIRRLVADGESLLRRINLVHLNEKTFSDGWIALLIGIRCTSAISSRLRDGRSSIEAASPLHAVVRVVRALKSYRQANERSEETVFAEPVSFLFHAGSAAGMAASFLCFTKGAGEIRRL